jgi:hypothetical protein
MKCGLRKFRETQSLWFENLRIPERMRAGRFFDEDFEEGSNALDMS